MLSDTLFNAATEISSWREEFPETYGTDPRMVAWLDSIVAQLEALGNMAGAPPSDKRTHKGECLGCHEITTINLGTLTCQPCDDRSRQNIQDLLEVVYHGDPFTDPEVRDAKYAEWDAESEAAHTEWLNETTTRVLAYFKTLHRADRDHILHALDKGLLEAR
jgi:hypothetical protein